MTDKEMAHEYAIENWEHYEEGQSDYAALKQAYLAGLEAGRPKWHKVADGDLPDDNRTVLDEAGDRFYYFRGHFYYESDSRFDCQPIAWCELPQYTEGVSK